MKFIDFGDLVEVTYDDERVELISKEEAVVLGYSPKQEIRITYKGQVYSGTQFGKLIDIAHSTIIAYYKKGFRTGEELIEAYNKQKASKQEIRITYQGQVYNSTQFNKLTGITHTSIRHYYNKGLRVGEEIIEAHNKQKAVPVQEIRITYRGKVYSSVQFSNITGINTVTIGKYYKKGLRTGEEIIEAYNKQKASIQEIRITYQGQMYSGAQFSNITGINNTTICRYYKNGLRTGEEIIEAYNKQKAPVKEITYQGEVYSCAQFSKLIGINENTVHNYYNKGLRTGEEMITYYNRNKH